ncbi:MAG: hypothetical protein IJW99_02210 [Clostridia bacterium]|nr:hypothetical protein [Clostridia bacterium]
MSTKRFGFADAIITPSHPSALYLDGYGFRVHPAEGVRDDLHAKVCAIMDGDDTYLIFSLDLVGLRSRTYELVADQITSLTGIPRDRIALTCIHTHAAPATGLIDELPIQYDYFAYVGECCGRAAIRAMERACEGTFSFMILPEPLRHSYNRRKRDVIDRSVRAAAFRDEQGTLRAVLCTAACHAVINTQYTVSADWLTELNALSSDEAPYLYFQGRCGDIDPHFEDGLSIDDKIRILGRELALPVRSAAQASEKGICMDGALCWTTEQVTVPMMVLNDTDALRADILAHEKAYFAAAPTDIKKHYNLRKLQWLRRMLRKSLVGESFDITVTLQLLTVGKQCVFAFVPFEVLTLTGNKLEEMFVAAGFPREAIYICAYSNSVEGYLAPAEEFPYGGYEVINAAAWYNTSRTCPESEAAVLAWFQKQLGLAEH